MKIQISNPQQSPWWKAQILWMGEYATEDLYEFWRNDRERLLDYLENGVKQAAMLTAKYRSLDQDQIEEIIQEKLCPEDTDLMDLDEKAQLLGISDPEWADTIREEVAQTILPWTMDPERMKNRQPLTMDIPEMKADKIEEKRAPWQEEIPLTGTMEEMLRYMNGK